MKKTDAHACPAWTPCESDVSSIMAMAWQDDTPFEAIALQFSLSESEVIAMMREHLKPRSFTVWRMRVRGRSAKHQALHRGRHAREEPRQHALDSPMCGEHAPSDVQDDRFLPPSITLASLR